MWSVSNLHPFTTSWHELPYDHIWNASNLSTIFVVLHTHLYGFHVLFPCIVVHEPPYQTYSSVWYAGFHRRFPRMNDRTDSTLVWGSLRLAPITYVYPRKLFIGIFANEYPSNVFHYMAFRKLLVNIHIVTTVEPLYYGHFGTSIFGQFLLQYRGFPL